MLGFNAEWAIKHSLLTRRTVPFLFFCNCQKIVQKHFSCSSDISSRMLSRLQNATDGKNAALSEPGNNEVGSPVHRLKDEFLVNRILDVPWFSNVSKIGAAQLKKEVSRERKRRYIYKNTESRRFLKLMRMCADKFGTQPTLEIFGKLGRETGVKEYNALIDICLRKARENDDDDEEGLLFQMQRIYQLLLSMKERGFHVEEETYGPILKHMVNMKMVQEFEFFSNMIRDNNPNPCFRISYYEMLLWIRIDDKDKIQERCNYVLTVNTEERFILAESYLLAFCENDRQEGILQLLEVLDIGRISSLDHISVIFKALGRLKLDHFVEKIILTLKTTDIGDEHISTFLYDYACSISNFAVEEIVQKFANLHEKFGVLPSITSGNKLIALCCDSFKLHAALNVADCICRCGMDVSVETFHPILHASELCHEHYLVHSIYSMMRNHNVMPKVETFKSMINLFVKLKDFEGAYNLLADMKEFLLIPSASIYNIILAGYLREKNSCEAFMVLKNMEKANLKPDSETFSYLIAYCSCEEDIAKYREELQHTGVPITKHIYMSLINAYANLGRFDLAKKVILDKNVPVKDLNELKNVLVSALSSNHQVHDAISVYNEIKLAGENIQPKAAVNLIEGIQYEGRLDRLLELLEDLKDSKNWFDGCARVLLYCVRYGHRKCIINLLKLLKSRDETSAHVVLNQIFCQISMNEPANIELGLELLQAIKEELGLYPSRTCLDFLLSTCTRAKNSHYAYLVWLEYDKVGLPYNVLTYLRMYQALLASGDQEAASKIILKVPRDDHHVRFIIKSCKANYVTLNSKS